MITVTNVDSFWGPTTSFIYLEDHPKYLELKEQLLKVSNTIPVFSSYFSISIDDLLFSTNLIGELPVPSYKKVIKDVYELNGKSKN